jgi:predicted glycosyltransferase
MKVMLVVTSLMGAGHLQRTLIIARAIRAVGGDPVIVSGGRPIPHLETGGVVVEHIPSLSADGFDYSRMMTPDDVVDDVYLRSRAACLVELFEEHKPDALVTELFPFGRRALSSEFLTLLAKAKGKAKIYASIRDVLEPKRKQKRAEETSLRLRRWYDGVLVHGDPALIGLEATWPLVRNFKNIIRYTGYVAEPSPPSNLGSSDEVLVSVGGGVIGRNLLETAVEAAGRGGRAWRLRVGGADAEQEVQRLQLGAGDAPVIIEAAASDYRARLAACACSVSLLGYNTCTDLLLAARPSVICPMREGDEREQRIRAEAFRQLSGFHQLDNASPEELSDLVETAIAAGPGKPHNVKMDGAATTAKLLIAG